MDQESSIFQTVEPMNKDLFCRLLLWLAAIVFSIAWGYSAAFAQERLESITISGPSTVADGSLIQLRALATIDGQPTDVTDNPRTRWSLDKTTYAIVGRGRLRAKSVPSCQDQMVTVTATHTLGGITRSETHEVQIVDDECVLRSSMLSRIAIGGPASLHENSSADFPVTATFSDGSTKTVPATMTENSIYTSLSGIHLTASEVPSNQTVTLRATYREGRITRTASKTIQILDTPKAATLQSISIGGPSSLNENSSADFPVTATFSDGSTKTVSATMTEDSAYASLSGIRLTASEVPSNQTVTLGASYTEAGITRTASKPIQILNLAPALLSITIGGPSTMNEGTSVTFPVTATMNDQSTKPVTATMTENSPYAVFNGATLTASLVTGNQVVTIGASYTENGVTRTSTKQVTIVDAPAPPVQGSHAGRFDSYAGASTCLSCHRQQAVQVYKSEHYQWSGKFGAINDFCIYPDINLIGKLTNIYGQSVDGGCLKCHPGLGAKPTKAANPTDADLANIDCLVCHAPNYKRTVDPATKTRYIPDEDAMGMTILEAAADIRPTSRDTCLNCHTKSGGGNNFKRGDIEEAHRNPPSRTFDVHMASASQGGEDFHCTECHTVSAHKISGRGVDLRIEEGTKPDCVTCHTATPPHSNSNINAYHVKRVHCTTCHIPTFAKAAPTDMFREWDAPGELNTTTGLYDPARTMQGNVTPKYKFWNGSSQFYNFGTPATVQPNGNVLMAGPVDASPATAGAKLYPFKVHTATQPIDLVTRYLLPLKIGRFYMEGDLVNAVPLGQEGVGWPKNDYDYQSTERWMGLFHEVSPKEQALGYNNSCTTCHGGTSTRMNLKSIGYTAKKPTTDLCNDCHGSKTYSFTAVHPRHTNKGINCSSCHDFSRAP